MDSPRPKSSSRPRNPSRLSQTPNSIKGDQPPGSALDTVSAAAIKKPSPIILPSANSLTTMQELLVLLSPSPSKRSRTRLVDRFEMVDDIGAESNGARKRNSKIKSMQGGCGSPRSSIGRRVRRRSERGEGFESRDDRELVEVLMEEIGKVRRRKRRQGKKDKIPALQSTSSIVTAPILDKVDEDVCEANLNAMGTVVYDLIMWKDVAKTSLWFGIGSLYILSTFFAKGINFSIISFLSQLGILILGASFISNTFSQRNDGPSHGNYMIKEKDILRVCKWFLPAVNIMISFTREVFSGEPSTTLKVIPFFLMGAEYGHYLTVWRLFIAGFFVAFTLPRLYSSYSSGIHHKVESTQGRIFEAWRTYSHKKLASISIVMVFWNLSSIRTRFMIAFLSLVILRCLRINLLPKEEANEFVSTVEQLEKALVIPETLSWQSGMPRCK